MIELKSVSMAYPGMEALRDVSLSVGDGEFVTLVGPSGCGKSTILRLVAGLVLPSAGEVAVADADSPTGHDADLGFVLQDATLLPWRSVFANAALPLELRRLTPDAIMPRVRESLDRVGLSDCADLLPRQLSGGMRMRASIARALALHPRLLLMDEPFGALDEISRQRLNDELLNLWQQQRWTCLFVTHSVQEAVFLSQRVLVMGPRPGRIAAEQRIDLPYPRHQALRTEAAFSELVRSLSQRLSAAGESAAENAL